MCRAACVQIVKAPPLYGRIDGAGLAGQLSNRSVDPMLDLAKAADRPRPVERGEHVRTAEAGQRLKDSGRDRRERHLMGGVALHAVMRDGPERLIKID